jgi:hypothetical protein
MDAGVCATATYDVVFGTFTPAQGATAAAVSPLPNGITQVAAIGTTVYGLATDDTIKRLGAFPTLSAGTTVANLRAPADAMGSIFPSGFLATQGTTLLAGYTKAMLAGTVTLVETTDGGVQYLDAMGNYDATGEVTSIGSGYVVNGLGLGTASNAGAFGIATTGLPALGLATFDSSWVGSGYAASTTDGVLLLGYYALAPVAGNYVRAVAPDTVADAGMHGMAFALANELLIASPTNTDDVMDLATAGSSAIVAFGGFNANFEPEVRRLERTPLGFNGANVDAGTTVPLLTTTDTCTKLLFVQSHGARVLVGLEDKNGRRLVDLQP